MKTLLLLLALTLTGCSSTNIAQWQKELANDKAIVTARISSVYGTANIVRIGLIGTNTTVSASPDGTVTVKSP